MNFCAKQLQCKSKNSECCAYKQHQTNPAFKKSARQRPPLVTGRFSLFTAVNYDAFKRFGSFVNVTSLKVKTPPVCKNALWEK